ncbi:endonuclease domain-containing protein [Sphingobium yanoikuyae]|uniref:endonuclease domain-containing protein n=1 Tax=Sphingobium yanoikuyae TaxID=13690 RepID=UPI0035B2DA0D
MALRINARLGQFAREMRREPTEYERRLWVALRGSQLEGFKFRRQAVIEPYICDFLCPLLGLIIEVDDDSHDTIKDRDRDFDLAHQGYLVLRFSNIDIRDNLEGVLSVILGRARAMPERQKITHPNPSLGREGL